MFAGVVAFQRTFLAAIPLEHGGIQVQRVAVRTQGQACHRPFPKRSEEPLNFAHAEATEQIANGFVGGKPFQAQRCSQGAIAPQPLGVGEAFGPLSIPLSGTP